MGVIPFPQKPTTKSEIEVTPDMIDAGVAAYEEFFGSFAANKLVEAVYKAMESMRLEPEEVTLRDMFDRED
jgi:hypothetical protein